MQKIIVIGSHGMLGTAIMERFSNNYEVVGLDKPDIDITDEHSTKKIIFALKPDVIINCAAINAVDDIETNQEVFKLAWKVNAKAVETLGSIASSLGVPLVHFSSDYVFNGHKKEGYIEDSEPAPINKYGETKFEGERLLKGITEKYYIIRLSRLFGPAGTGEGVKKSFVDKMIELAEAGKEIKVVDAEFSSPTYSKDLADFVYGLLDKKLPYGIYHAVNQGACTWYEWAREIFNIKGLTVQIIKVNEADLARPSKRPAYSELLNTRAEPMRPWQEALKDYLSIL